MSTVVHLNNVESFISQILEFKMATTNNMQRVEQYQPFEKKELLNLFQIKSRWSECESQNGNTKWRKKIAIGLVWKKLFSLTCTARFLQILWKTRPVDS